jgi:hypothetical protein
MSLVNKKQRKNCPRPRDTGKPKNKRLIAHTEEPCENESKESRLRSYKSPKHNPGQSKPAKKDSGGPSCPTDFCAVPFFLLFEAQQLTSTEAALLCRRMLIIGEVHVLPICRAGANSSAHAWHKSFLSQYASAAQSIITWRRKKRFADAFPRPVLLWHLAFRPDFFHNILSSPRISWSINIRANCKSWNLQPEPCRGEGYFSSSLVGFFHDSMWVLLWPAQQKSCLSLEFILLKDW